MCVVHYPINQLEVKPWAGLRPFTPDGLPYIGLTRGIENLMVATGHAMLGISLAPITGKLVKEIVDGEQPAGSREPYRVGRFGRS